MQEQSKTETAALKEKAFKSVIWTFVRIGTDQFFNFLLFAVLARLLGPSAFGLFALAFIFIEIGRTITSSGLVDAVIREPTVTPVLIDTIFWANIAMAVLIGLASVALAGPVAVLLQEPELRPLIQVLALVPVISAAGSTHMALRLREFGHRTVAARALISGIVGGGAALAAALAGWGVWSFVVQRFVTELATTLLAWRAYPWLPGRQVSLEKLKSVFSFSANMLLTQLLVLLLVRVQDLIIGIKSDASAVGVYRTAWKTVEVISQATIVPFSFIAMPTLSRLQHDREGFAAAYRRLAIAGAVLSLPAIVGFGVLANDLIPLFYGPKWGASIPVAQMLAAMAVPFALSFFVPPALAAAGKSATISKVALLQLGLTVALSWLAAPYGVVAVAGAYVARAYITTPVQLWALQRETGISAWRTLQGVAPSFFATAVMAIVLIAVYRPVHAAVTSSILSVALLVAMGAMIYGVALLAFGGREMRGQITQLRSMIAGRRS